MSGGQPLHCFPIAARQCQLLASRPALDLPLPGKSLIPGWEFLVEDQPHRQPGRRVPRERAHLMRCQPQLQIVRMSRINGAVGTPQHIDVEAHLRLSLRSSFDKLRMSGAGVHHAPYFFSSSSDTALARAMSRNMYALRRGRRFCVPSSVAISPNFWRNPSAHSKLSWNVQCR
jgi:hypothetical protein